MTAAKLSRSAPRSRSTHHNNDPLVALLRSARRAATPRVRQWLEALLAEGEKAEGQEVRK